MSIHNKMVTARVLFRGKIRREGGFLALSYGNKKLKFLYNEWVAYPLEEIFIGEQYRKLRVGGKTVIDIGASVGDSPIYFVCRGAKRVYGYEPDRARYEESLKNIRLNRMSERIKMFNKVYDGRRGDVLKMDCEGCEYSSLRVLGRFDELIMEYHSGDKPITRALKRRYQISVKEKDSKEGILYARKPAAGA